MFACRGPAAFRLYAKTIVVRGRSTTQLMRHTANVSLNEAHSCVPDDMGSLGSLLSVEERMISLFKPPQPEKGLDVLSVTLNNIEADFLNGAQVCAANVDERDLIARFSKTQMNQNPLNNPMEYFDEVMESVVENSIHCCSPTMIGHMTTSLPFYMRPLSKLVTTIHANNVKIETGKGSTFLEKEAIAMLHRELFQHSESFYDQHAARPDVALGVVCSGGTIANSTAMWIARNRRLPPEGDFSGCDKQGLVKGLKHHNYEGAVIIGSEVMHYSMKKAADVLGIGTEGLLTVPFDDSYRVDINAMRLALEECRNKNFAVIAVVGVAGGTETGSIDDLNAIASLARDFDVHFHVDAAWGGPVMFSSKNKGLIAGIEQADTVTLDGHKQLYTPMGCGLCFLKEPSYIHAVEKTANYIIRKDSYDLGKFSMEGSRPAVSMYLHANLQIMGTKGLGSLVDRSIGLVQYMLARLKGTGMFEEVLTPMTNILLYRYMPQALRQTSRTRLLTADENKLVSDINTALQNAQKADGKTFVSRTTIFCPRQETRIVALRVVIANPLTTEAHIDLAIEDQLALVADLEQHFKQLKDTETEIDTLWKEQTSLHRIACLHECLSYDAGQ